MRDRLVSEIFKFLVSLSLTESQHFDSIQAALEACDTEAIVQTVCSIVKHSKAELGMSALGFFTLLLSQEMQKESDEDKPTLIRSILDTKHSADSDGQWDDDLHEAREKKSDLNNAAPIERALEQNKNVSTDDELYVGADICKVLVNLFVAYNYAKAAKTSRPANDKEVVTVALTNLLCISAEAKKQAIADGFPSTCMGVLKEIYVKINAIPALTYKAQRDRGQKVL